MVSPLTSYSRYIEPFARPFAQVVVDSIDVTRVDSAIDHGAGTGLVTRLLHQRKALIAVTAVDPSADLLLGLAGEPNCSIVQGTAAALDDLPLQVDAVVSSLVLSFCPDPVKDLAILRSQTSPNGQLAVLALGGPAEVEPFRRYWDAVRSVVPAAWEPERYPHMRFLEPNAVAEVTTSAGWSAVRYSTVVRTRTMLDRTAWDWLHSVLPIGEGSGYRALNTDETAAVRENFFADWGTRRRVSTECWFVQAVNAEP